MRQVSRLLIVTMVIGLFAACGLPGSPANMDSQIQTAIIETSIAEATFQAAVYEAAQGTPTAIQLPATITPEPPIDPYTLSEEELAALIDANYEDAIYNSADASESAQEDASDNAITEEEIYNTMYYVYEAEASIHTTEELITLYEELYGDLANETLAVLTAIEEDLSQLAATMTEIENLFTQGSATASEAIDRLNTIATEIQNTVEEALKNKQQLRDTLQANLNERERKYSSLPATEIASDRDGAILLVYAYLDIIKAAFQDQKVSLDEMNLIAQLAANAKASLQEQGGPGLQILGNSIDGLTRQISRGQWPQARSGIGNFEGSLPQRPSRP
jgi:hypothetical protein